MTKKKKKVKGLGADLGGGKKPRSVYVCDWEDSVYAKFINWEGNKKVTTELKLSYRAAVAMCILFKKLCGSKLEKAVKEMQAEGIVRRKRKENK